VHFLVAEVLKKISDKRLRIEFQPAQTNGAESVNVCWTSICIASSVTWKGQTKFRHFLLGKISVDAHGFMVGEGKRGRTERRPLAFKARGHPNSPDDFSIDFSIVSVLIHAAWI